MISKLEDIMWVDEHGTGWGRKPSHEEVIAKVNEIIDYLNQKEIGGCGHSINKKEIEKTIDYEENDNGKRLIYCTPVDTEVAQLLTNVTCPYCGHEQQEFDKDECGETYIIRCENHECEKEYAMYFDAS